MSRCFEQGHQAYARGDGALAKELSTKGKEHQRRMEDLNKNASEWIFTGMCAIFSFEILPQELIPFGNLVNALKKTTRQLLPALLPSMIAILK